MMNKRHLTADERQQLLNLADEVGAVEILRCLAGVICVDHPQASVGVMFRTAIMRLARRLDADREPA
jgi:hypothetical protein